MDERTRETNEAELLSKDPDPPTPGPIEPKPGALASFELDAEGPGGETWGPIEPLPK